MRRSVYVMACVLMLQASAAEAHFAPRDLSYRKIDPRSGRVTATIRVKVSPLPDDRLSFTHTVEDGGTTVRDEIVTEADYRAERIRRAEDGLTDYTIAIKEHALYLTGLFKGTAVDRKIPLDGKAFYGVPWIHLSGFVRSGEQNMRFWTLREEDLVKVMMQARKRGETKVKAGGKMFDAVRVNYSVMNLKDKYNRVLYYYRKTDGVLVRAVLPDGSVLELTGEK